MDAVALTQTKLQDPENPNWAQLNDYLWDHEFDFSVGKSRFVSKEHMRLSESDWEMIQQMIVDRAIPVTLCNTNSGRSIGMTLWTERCEPIPGVVEEPRPIITISAVHLPMHKGGASFDLGWKVFSKIANSKRNIQLLHKHALPIPGNKTIYAY